jgi:hypothetical protein
VAVRLGRGRLVWSRAALGSFCQLAPGMHSLPSVPATGPSRGPSLVPGARGLGSHAGSLFLSGNLSEATPAPRAYIEMTESVRVFERERGSLLERLEKATKERRVAIVSSDVVVMETVKGLDSGARRSHVAKGFDALWRVVDSWIHLNSLIDEEARGAVEDWRTNRPFSGVVPFLSWNDCVARIGMSPKKARMAQSIGPRFLAEAYAGGFSAALTRFHEYLVLPTVVSHRRVVAAAPDMDHATKKLFLILTAKMVMKDFALAQSEAIAFANRVWESPAVCPYWRFSIVEKARILRDPGQGFKRNDRIDIGHAGVAPYVAYFVSADHFPRDAVSRFNNQAARAGLSQTQVCRSVEELLDLLPT